MNKVEVIREGGTTTSQLYWYTFSQNNSGGFFIQNDVVAEYVCIQASNAEAAIDKALRLFANYSRYCECCGERWSYYVSREDGTDVPCIYDTPVSETKPDWAREQCILHYADGRVERVTFEKKA